MATLLNIALGGVRTRHRLGGLSAATCMHTAFKQERDLLLLPSAAAACATHTTSFGNIHTLHRAHTHTNRLKSSAIPIRHPCASQDNKTTPTTPDSISSNAARALSWMTRMDWLDWVGTTVRLESRRRVKTKNLKFYARQRRRFLSQSDECVHMQCNRKYRLQQLPKTEK